VLKLRILQRDIHHIVTTITIPCWSRAIKDWRFSWIP